MALVTRCPDCATAFRITPLHLQAHGGDVRCGHCARVFNGFTDLATMHEPEAEKPVETKTEERPESRPEVSPGDEFTNGDTQALSDPEGSPSARAHTVTPGRGTPDEVNQDEVNQEEVARAALAFDSPTPEEPVQKGDNTSDSSPTASAGRKKATSEISDTISPMSENYAFERDPSENYAFDEVRRPVPSLVASFAWGFGNLVLLVGLAAQAIYAYRSEISVLVPDAKPYLEQYCKLLQCSLPAPQYAKLLNIESSEMQADAEQPGVITLHATVHNYATYPQALPSFQLTLIDTKNQPLASRTFPPDAYLAENASRPRVVAPDDEFNVRLHLDSGDLNAAGYRLLLLYPQS